MGLQKEIIKAEAGLNGETSFTSGNKTGSFVRGTLALGVPGNIYDATPARITSMVLSKDSEVGGPAFINEDEDVAGIIVNGREYANKGSAGDPLKASLAIPAGTAVDVCTFGHIVMTAALAKDALEGFATGRVIVGEIPVDEHAGELETEEQKKEYEDLLKSLLVVVEIDGLKDSADPDPG